MSPNDDTAETVEPARPSFRPPAPQRIGPKAEPVTTWRGEDLRIIETTTQGKPRAAPIGPPARWPGTSASITFSCTVCGGPTAYNRIESDPSS